MERPGCWVLGSGVAIHRSCCLGSLVVPARLSAMFQPTTRVLIHLCCVFLKCVTPPTKGHTPRGRNGFPESGLQSVTAASLLDEGGRERPQQEDFTCKLVLTAK